MLDYGARWYDPALGRFVSADTIVPNPANPQSLNRFAYVHNNPCRYVDPSGRCGRDADEDLTAECEEIRSELQDRYTIHIEGEWFRDDMLILELVFGDLESGMGGQSYVIYVFGGVRIVRGETFENSQNPGTLSDGTIQLPDSTFAFGADAARFFILHETYHSAVHRRGGANDLLAEMTNGSRIVEYRPGEDDTEVGVWVWEAEGQFTNYQRYGRGGDCNEDAAETWAGVMFRGDWDALIATPLPEDGRIHSRISSSQRVAWASWLVTDYQKDYLYWSDESAIR